VPRVLTDREIEDLIQEPKPLPANWQTRLRPKPKARYQHDERQLEVASEADRQFRVIARRNRQNQLDFSIILLFEDADGSEYNLIRYNGRHPSRHTNRWEKDRGLPNSRFDPDFHIHRATERYQRDGYDIDGYAEVANAYGDFGSAMEEFLDACGFQRAASPQQRLL
jgi:hypothetical protein